jgi:uncharacterized membrane protein
MPLTTFTGLPLHPQMIVLPAGLLPFSLVLDIMHVQTGDDSYADAAYYTMMGGFLGGIAAGVAGAADYSTIPDDSQAKRIGTLHGLMNVGLLALTGLNLSIRRRQRSPGTLPRAVIAYRQHWTLFFRLVWGASCVSPWNEGTSKGIV